MAVAVGAYTIALRGPLQAHQRLPDERMRPDLRDRSAVRCHRADHREMVSRGPSTRRIRARHEWQGIEPGLVYVDDSALLILGFARREGIRSSRKAVIATSSRWLARRTG